MKKGWKPHYGWTTHHSLCLLSVLPYAVNIPHSFLGDPRNRLEFDLQLHKISSPKSLSKFLNVSVSHSWSSIFNNNIGSGRLNITTINVSGEFRKKVAFPWICKLFPLPADTSSIRCNINKSAIYNKQNFSHSTEKVSNTIKCDKTCH